MNKEMVKRIRENIIKIIGIALTLICSIILCIIYIPYLAILFGLLSILILAFIIMLPFLIFENYFKKKELNRKQKSRDELWKKFKNGEIDEDEYDYEMEFLN